MRVTPFIQNKTRSENSVPYPGDKKPMHKRETEKVMAIPKTMLLNFVKSNVKSVMFVWINI